MSTTGATIATWPHFLGPVTSRLHELFWAFLPRSLAGEYRSAWHLEAERLRRPVGGFGHNQMPQFQAAQAILVLVVLLGFGPGALLAWLGAVAVGIVLFQLVNYV